MVKGILASAGAMRPALLAQDILANNLANARTDGFRGDRTAFQLVASRAPGGGPIEETALAPQLATRIDPRPGSFQVTDRPLDVALQGDGYFVVNTPDGERYTRAGHFLTSAEGSLVTPAGHEVLADGGAITLPGGAQVTITAQGQVLADGNLLGQLQVVSFPDEPAFSHAGGGLLATDSGAEPAENVRVLQGVIEGPNVEPVQAMVDMITLLRHFEMNQKALQAQDESLGNLLSWVRA